MYACTERCVLLTGREAVSRGIVETVCLAAGVCPGFLRSIPLNRDDDVRTEAIEKELIKLGSHVSTPTSMYKYDMLPSSDKYGGCTLFSSQLGASEWRASSLCGQSCTAIQAWGCRKSVCQISQCSGPPCLETRLL